MRRFFLALILGALSATAAFAADVYSADVEHDAREVGKSLRCVVCQNQSIEDSSAPLAADMRNMVRERLAAGASKQQVIDYMADRYGNFVLLKPPFQNDTLLLWLGPIALALIAGAGWFTYLRPRRTQLSPPLPLSPEELEKLSRLSDGPANT
jgi:cytochrome c-type biogenesis protein CcmH